MQKKNIKDKIFEKKKRRVDDDDDAMIKQKDLDSYLDSSSF
jgi:hypothetical protein